MQVLLILPQIDNPKSFKTTLSNMRLPKFTKTGFTLIELLVAILIIGVLISMLVAVAGRTRARAYIAGCADHLRQIGIALSLYADDHGGCFPSRDDDLQPLYPSYVDDLAIFTCPATGTKLISGKELVTPSPEEIKIGKKGMDYEYRGSEQPAKEPLLSEPPLAAPPATPSQQAAERMSTRYLLAWDTDNKGDENRVLNKEDNHGALGGNKLFSDGSVRWFPMSQWGFGE